MDELYFSLQGKSENKNASIQLFIKDKTKYMKIIDR